MPKNHKIYEEDFSGSSVEQILASSGYKSLKVVTFIYYDAPSEVVFQVTHKIGDIRQRTTGYNTLEEAISNYNMA